jgi:hypothetical protein
MAQIQEKTPERIDVETRHPVEDETEDLLFCHRHPQVETALRCYQCQIPICAKCARRTPVGYICKACQSGVRRRFEQSRPLDYVIAGAAATVLGAIASVLVLLGGWWILIFLSPLAGAAIAEVVWRLIGRRYGRHLWWIVSLGILAGSLPALALNSLQLLALLSGNWWGLAGVLTWGLHVAIVIGSAVARLRMS